MLTITPELVLDYLGKFGPMLLIFVTTLLLRNKRVYLTFFIIGSVTNMLVNIGLKLLLKEPRPNHYKYGNELGILYGIPIPFNVYGMPSSHAQTCGFLLALITYIFHNSSFTCIYIILTFIVILQRYVTQMHSITQLIAGLFVGYSIGYITYLLAKWHIVGDISLKLDDFAPK